MLDSNGTHSKIEIACERNGCSTHLELPIYTPLVGHAGEALNEGPYFDSRSYRDNVQEVTIFEAGRLFRKLSTTDSLQVEVYLAPIARDYGYDGMIMPHFTPDGDVLWICTYCLDLLKVSGHPWALALDTYEKNVGSAAPCLTDGIFRRNYSQHQSLVAAAAA